MNICQMLGKKARGNGAVTLYYGTTKRLPIDGSFEINSLRTPEWQERSRSARWLVKDRLIAAKSFIQNEPVFLARKLLSISNLIGDLSMKKTILAALLLSSGMAHAAFTGMFAPAMWTQTPGTGSVNSFDTSTLSFSSGDDDFSSASNTDVTIALPAAGTVSFAREYVTSDDDPFWDPFIALTPSAV
jgi:hypothetical protein